MRALIFALMILMSARVAAQARSVSHTDWNVSREQVTVRVFIPATETWHLVASGQPPPSTEKVAAYMQEHLSVQAAGSACEAIDQGYDIGRINSLAAGQGLLGFEIIFHCAGSAPLTLRNAILFDRAPQHIDYARIVMAGTSSTQLFTSQRQTLDLDRALKSAGLASYASLGASHIVHGAARLCFLMGLMLLANTRREWLLAAAALACGYATSALILVGDLVPHMESLEAAIGLLVGLCAACWLSMRLAATPVPAFIVSMALAVLSLFLVRSNEDAAWTVLGAAIFAAGLLQASSSRPAVALFALPLLFAALDGLILWGDYTRLRLGPLLGLPALLTFNAGALLMELGIMALLYAGTVWWARAGVRASFNRLAGELAATALAGLGAFWLLAPLKGG